MSKTQNQVQLDSGEIKEFLKHIITNNRFIQEKGMNPVAIEIIGESGLGKTTVVMDMAKTTGLDVVKLNLSQLDELGDLVGYPVRQFQLCKEADIPDPLEQPSVKTEFQVIEKKLPNGQIVKIKQKVNVPVDTSSELTDDCLWVDETAVEQYTKRGYNFTGQKRMSYCPPEWIADKTSGGILILDDYTRADSRFLQACMELCDRQTYISWKLPKDWHVILTSNPDDGNYLVNAIDVAQKTRFISVTMKWNVDRWAEWAENQQIDGRCINFVLRHPEIISPAVNPRSLTTFFNSISSIKDFEKELPMIQMIGEGSIGPEAATLFTTFINNRLDKLIGPKEILQEPKDEKVRQELLNAICNGDPNSGNYRADIASILTTRFINYTIMYAEDHQITQNHINRIIFLINDPDIFTDDLKYHIIKKILNGNKIKFQKALFDKKVQEYVTK